MGLGFSESSKDYALVSSHSARFNVIWGRTFGNTLERSGLTIVFSEGGKFMGGLVLEEPKEIERIRYELDWDKTRRVGWRERSEARRFYTSQQLADVWVRRLFDRSRDRALQPDTWPYV